MRPLDQLIGAENLGRIINAAITTAMHLDGLPEPVARNLVCTRAADRDPLLLAAPGQLWTLREDIDPARAPGLRLAIQSRSTEPPAIQARISDGTAVDTWQELPLSALSLYELEGLDTETSLHIGDSEE
jgi:hypothetical protein